MNQRIINEIVRKAREISVTDSPTGGRQFDLDVFHEKFAELIVQECMTTVLKESKWYWDKDEFESSTAVQNAARRVKEHFGVE